MTRHEFNLRNVFCLLRNPGPTKDMNCHQHKRRRKLAFERRTHAKDACSPQRKPKAYQDCLMLFTPPPLKKRKKRTKKREVSLSDCISAPPPPPPQTENHGEEQEAPQSQKERHGEEPETNRTRRLFSTAIESDLSTLTFWNPLIFPFNHQKVKLVAGGSTAPKWTWYFVSKPGGFTSHPVQVFLGSLSWFK